MKRLATAVATLATLVAAAPVHAVPVVITYSITGDSGQGIPGVLGGAPVQGGSVKLLWSMTSINGEFTGAAAILSLRLTNSFGTLSLEPTPVQQFRNANGDATILQVPAPSTLTALNSEISYLAIVHRIPPPAGWDFSLRFGGYTLTTGTPAPHYFSIAAVGNEISRVVANPSLPALGPIPRSLGALALILLAYSALCGRMRGARSRPARSLLAGSGRAH